MDKMQYVKIAEMERPQAEVAESFLEAEGTDVELVDESVWRSSYAITFQPVQVFVPREKVKQASVAKAICANHVQILGS